MTIRELVYNLKELIKDKSDDVILSDRQVEFMINYLREKLIVQQLQKGRSISSNIKQDLGEVALQRIDGNTGGVKVTDRTILRTTVTIPQPIELDQMDLITYVGGLDKQSPFTYKTKANAKWNKYNKYSSKEPLAYYSNGYIYITGCANPGLKWINIEGVFLNPRDVHNYKNPDGTPCYDPDVDNYPLSGRMVDTIMDLIKTKELNLFMQIVEDSTNNASNKS